MCEVWDLKALCTQRRAGREGEALNCRHRNGKCCGNASRAVWDRRAIGTKGRVSLMYGCDTEAGFISTRWAAHNCQSMKGSLSVRAHSSGRPCANSPELSLSSEFQAIDLLQASALG